MKATGDLEFTKHMFTKLVPRHIENERMLGRGDGGARGRNPFIVKIHDFFPPREKYLISQERNSYTFISLSMVWIMQSFLHDFSLSELWLMHSAFLE